MKNSIYRLLMIFAFLLSMVPDTSTAASKKGAPKESDISDETDTTSDHKLTYDLSVSAGRYGSTNYTEFNLGLNYFLQSWVAWRNAAFYRSADQESARFYGLDSSVRAISNTFSESFGFTAFGGAGYRFANKEASAPLAEAGLNLILGGLRIGGGVKVVLYSIKDSNLVDDTQYFIILGGGGAL